MLCLPRQHPFILHLDELNTRYFVGLSKEVKRAARFLVTRTATERENDIVVEDDHQEAGTSTTASDDQLSVSSFVCPSSGCSPVSVSVPSVLCPPPPLSYCLSCRFLLSVFPAHLPSPSLRTVVCWWQPSVLVVAAVVEWIDLSVLCVVSRVSSFFRLFLLPPPMCGWSAVVVLAICCAIRHGCSECGSCFLTRDWLRHEAVSWSS